MINPALFSSDSYEWGTPRELFAELHAEFNFDIDVCASVFNAKLPRFWTKEDDFFKQDASNLRCFMNPVYGNAEFPCKEDRSKCTKKRCVERGFHCDIYQPGIEDFMRRAFENSVRRNAITVSVIPARTDADWWQKLVHPVLVTCGVKTVRFLPGRLQFELPEGSEVKLTSAPFPSAVVVYSKKICMRVLEHLRLNRKNDIDPEVRDLRHV